MAKKKKTEEISPAEIKEEMKQEAIIDEKIAEEQLESSEEAEKPKKKKEIKKLSETELRRVMTDTKETIVPLTDYIACSIHLGTKVITPDLRKYVYKRRADGLAVLNTNLIDDKIRESAKFLNEFDAKDVFIVCKREAGWPAVEKFSEVTGIRCFCKKYPAGIITNLQLETFFEAKLAIVCDPWVDKNALNDALKLKLPVLGICDTNNYATGITQVIPANNKSRKSIGLILFILAREFLKAQGKDDEAKELKLEDFAGKIEENTSESAAPSSSESAETSEEKPKRRKSKETEASEGV
jgi:small subunit ribosomal protein S2